MFKTIIIIGAGGFMGTVARFLLGKFVQNHFYGSFPLGTFCINVLGCFLIGMFYGLTSHNNWQNDHFRLFLTTGFCGGFTTFSTFSYENITLLRDGNFFQFFLYTGLSIFIGFMATYLGIILSRG